MNAGRLRHTIQIQAKSISRDSGGGAVETWSTITNGERPAEVVPIGSREAFVEQQLQESVTHKIRTRYLSGVTTKHRVLFGTRVFDIQSVINWGERDIELALMCVERKAA